MTAKMPKFAYLSQLRSEQEHQQVVEGHASVHSDGGHRRCHIVADARPQAVRRQRAAAVSASGQGRPRRDVLVADAGGHR